MAARKQMGMRAQVLMTSMVLPALGQAVHYTLVPDGPSSTSASPPTNANQTVNKEQASCTDAPSQDQPVGVWIGTFLGGAIVGALLAVVILRCVHRRSHAPVPMDDVDGPEAAHFDVNSNNDQMANEELDAMPMEGSSMKGHKKLERLVPSVKTKPDKHPMSRAATPLIHCTDSSSLDDDNTTSTTSTITTTTTTTTATSPMTTTVSSPTSTSASKPRASKPPPVALKPMKAPKGKSSEEGVYEIPDMTGELTQYQNVGSHRPLTQPYDTLQIIAEEVEYINQPTHIYEPIREKSTTKK